MTDIYGQIIGRQQVEAAVLSTLQTWIGTAAVGSPYLAEIERQNGLSPRTIPVPPSADSYHGGLDFDTWRQGLEPVVIVNAEPDGDAEKRGSGEYSQWYLIHVAAICVADEKFFYAAAVNQVEDTARYLGDLYGAAVKGVLTEHFNSNIADWIGRVDLVEDPVTEWVNPEVPGVVRSVCAIRAFVFPTVDESLGPATVPSNPYDDPASGPDVETTNLTFTAVPDNEQV